jgi:hypothetical protein
MHPSFAVICRGPWTSVENTCDPASGCLGFRSVAVRSGNMAPMPPNQSRCSAAPRTAGQSLHRLAAAHANRRPRQATAPRGRLIALAEPAWAADRHASDRQAEAGARPRRTELPHEGKPRRRPRSWRGDPTGRRGSFLSTTIHRPDRALQSLGASHPPDHARLLMLFAHAIELIAPADFSKKLIMIPAQEDSMAHHFADVYLDIWAHAREIRDLDLN